MGVIEHLDKGEDGTLVTVLVSMFLGVNAFKSKGELLLELDDVDVENTVSGGVIGSKEKLFEEDFAGFIVVE